MPNPTPPNVLIRKLDQSGFLTKMDRATLSALMSSTRMVSDRTDLIRKGDRPKYVLVMQDGFACRYQRLADGRRQITGILVPGDVCDPHVDVIGAMDLSWGH